MDQATHNKIVSFVRGIDDEVLRDLKSHGGLHQLLVECEDDPHGFSLNVQGSLEKLQYRSHWPSSFRPNNVVGQN